MMNLIEFKAYCDNECLCYDKIIDRQIDMIMELLRND
jgi:hypothetical protein